ncbi:Roquin-1 [Armadillidium vulgare]|nr:Roquin-1 [Armadillidium vulgare]
MPIQAPQWTEFLSCPICCHEFDGEQRGPISLGCGHTVCRGCLAKLQRNQCPYDQTVMRLELDQLPVNGALLSLVNHTNSSSNPNSHGSEGGDDGSLPQSLPQAVPPNFAAHYYTANQCIKELALLLKPFAGCGLNGASTSILSRPMQRKLVTLINCQLVEEEGRARAVRAARSLGERTVTELILHHQNHHQLSANLWAAVRSRGCQFLGPAMQEEVLKLVLLALEDGSALSRKVLVMFVVQRLEPHFPQASKTSIGHVVQLLYRASCFKVSKREGDSSLMQLKEEFRTYEALRREHDAQIVQIATEAGLRIAPDQWSSLLYGDTAHKSHMQSIIDKLQTPQSFGQSVQELVIALQRTGDPGQLSSLRLPLELLASLDPSPDSDVPGWESCARVMEAVKSVVTGLVQFIQHHGNRKITEAHHAHNAKYKTKYSATYSIWTSGANLSNISWAAGKSPEKTWDPSKGYRTNAETVKHGPKEDFIPFDPPVVLYQPGFTAYVSYPPSLDFMNTIGHGIIDPPHLHMSQLDPSGTRPSDPILDFIQMGQEERQRQQFIAAKEGIEAYCLHQKF